MYRRELGYWDLQQHGISPHHESVSEAIRSLEGQQLVGAAFDELARKQNEFVEAEQRGHAIKQLSAQTHVPTSHLHTIDRQDRSALGLGNESAGGGRGVHAALIRAHVGTASRAASEAVSRDLEDMRSASSRASSLRTAQSNRVLGAAPGAAAPEDTPLAGLTEAPAPSRARPGAGVMVVTGEESRPTLVHSEGAESRDASVDPSTLPALPREMLVRLLSGSDRDFIDQAHQQALERGYLDMGTALFRVSPEEVEAAVRDARLSLGHVRGRMTDPHEMLAEGELIMVVL